ncbi:MAG: ADP-ribosylglycohydrolase family protein [Bacteroidota bacterium]|nr:ADP-ribosylglycohydrolase family protein [Bacteroidota bacterium]
MKKKYSIPGIIYALAIVLLVGCSNSSRKAQDDSYITLSKEVLQDKIKGAWALQTIGVAYGGPTEFKYLGRIIPDSVEIVWADTMMLHWMTTFPGLYDDIYLDLTFVDVMEKEGLDAPALSHGMAVAKAKYWLWHANQQARYNILYGILPPESGHWLNNPHADDIDFQIEADFAGIMSPAMPNTALEICDRVGHVMNSGDGYYGGVFVAGMYSYAFIENDIPLIVDKALAMIPVESTFYQCIADVIQWHQEYPDDWKKNWQLIEDKWGPEIGCPYGAYSVFNIDAKINSAYVVLGLLYGEGDLGKTMEIATRAGQDSDCNPGTAGGVIGTIIGYDQIPEYWGKGLELIEDMNFQNISTSLNDVYEISYRHALEVIAENGGQVTESEVNIKLQEPVIAPLEQNYTGYELGDEIKINKRFTSKDPQELEVEFEGVGAVLTGRVRHIDFDDTYALISDEETLNNYKLIAEFYIDGELSKTMELPLSFVERTFPIFFQYELPEGKHTLKMKITNPHEKVYLQLWNMVVYKKKHS